MNKVFPPKVLSTNMSTNENVPASEKMYNMVTATVPVGNYPQELR